MRKEIISRQREAMTQAGLDALVANSPENFAYTAGFVVPSHPLMRWRHAMAIVTRDGHEAMVIVDMEESTVRSQARDVEIRVWGEFTDEPMESLANLLKDLKLSEGSIGLELDYLLAAELADELGEATVVTFGQERLLYVECQPARRFDQVHRLGERLGRDVAEAQRGYAT